LLFSKVTSIESILLTGNTTNLNSPKPPIKPPADQQDIMQNVIGLAIDYDNQLLYFSDIQKGDIYSVFLNGTGFQSLYSSEFDFFADKFIILVYFILLCGQDKFIILFYFADRIAPLVKRWTMG
jgi:hypothetical protein